MKLLIKILVMFLSEVFVVSNAWSLSYTSGENSVNGFFKVNSGPLSYYKCPKCDNVISRAGAVSENTTGAKRYTDGRIAGSLYSERPEIVICGNCRYPFWLRDDYADPDCFQSLVFLTTSQPVNASVQKAVFYGPETYDKFIRNHVFCSRDEEKYLLTRYWWTLNDKVRTKLMFLSDPCDNDTARANLNRLIEILEDENDELTFLPGTNEGETIENSKIFLRGMKSLTMIFESISDFYGFTRYISSAITEVINTKRKQILESVGRNNKANLEKINSNLITASELYRNLGRFEECEEILSLIESDNKVIKFRKSVMAEQCGSKIRIVSEL